MAAFPTPNTLSSASSLSYHHLLSNGTQPSHHTSPTNINGSETSIVNDIHPNGLFEGNTDFSFCLPSSQQGSFFDVSMPSSHCHTDPLVRHFFNYRQTDSNHSGNYYSNPSTGSFVNAFDYAYPTAATVASDAAVPNQPPPPHHPLAASYMGYPQQQQVQQQQQQQQQQQNIYPWMRRIHHGCGESRTRSMLRNSSVVLFIFKHQCSITHA